MNSGDRVRVVWPDGYVVTGTYVRKERGFYIVLCDDETHAACNEHTVKIEVIGNENR